MLSIVSPCFGQTGLECGRGRGRRPSVNPPSALRGLHWTKYGAPMHSTLNPKPTDDPDDFVVVASNVVRVAPADEELSKLLQEAAPRSSNPQTRTESDFPPVPPVDTTFRPAVVNNVQVPGDRPSIGKSAVRAFTGFLLAASIGVAAIAFQTPGNPATPIIPKL